MGPEVHYHVNNNPPPVPSLSHRNPVHTLQSYFWRICCSIILLPTPRSFKWPLSFNFAYQNCICSSFLSHMCNIPHQSHFPLFDAQIIFYEEYQWCSFSICSLLQSLVNSSLLDPYVFLSTLFLTTLNLQSSLNVKRLHLTPK